MPSALHTSRAWARLLYKAVASNFDALHQPYKLTWVITKECHSKCVHCDIWKVKPKNELTLDEITEFAKQNPYFSWIDFTGGEPTDRKDFTDIIETFATHCRDLLFVHFPTNGLKPKRVEAVCQEIAKHRFAKTVVTCSVDGPQEVNDTLRGIPGDFERVTETFRRIREIRGITPYIGMTLYDTNVGLVAQAIDELKHCIPNFDERKLHLNIPHISEHYYENAGAPPTATLAMADAVERIAAKYPLPQNAFGIVERLYQRRVRNYLTSGVCPTDCAALMASCFMSEHGEVYPCNIWNEPLGSIRDHNYQLAPLLKSEKAATLRSQLLQKDCPNCWTPCEAYQSIVANVLRVKSRA